jgi:hypothetical protein
MRLQPRASGRTARRREPDNDEREEKMRSKHRVASLAAMLATCLATVGVNAAVAPSAGAAGSNSLTVKAGEYTYKMSGSPKAGWTQITFQNDGNEYHMMAVLPLKKGVTVAQVKKAAASQDQSAFDPIAGKGQVFGAPDLLSPGEQTTVITKLPAGHYAVACFVPAPDGESHLAHGMVKLLDVSTSKSDLTPPTDGLVAVTIADDAITLPTSGMPAHGWAKVTNNASEPRTLDVAHYLGNATFDEANAYFQNLFSDTPPTGDAPAALQGGAQSIAPGGVAYVQLDLEPGRNVLVSDTDDDMDGTQQIYQEFTVK